MNTGTNDPTNWEHRLAGEVVPIQDGIPDYGFYRVRSRDKQTWRAIAYWYAEDGSLKCYLDGNPLDEQRACEIWPWASKSAITYELYRAVIWGEPWPDLSEAVTRSNNAPADNSFEALSDRIGDLAREADKIIDVKTQDEANQAADLANKLGELEGVADARRVEDKRPHDEAAHEVQARWKPIIDAAALAKRTLKGVIARFLAAKETAERTEREAAVRAGAPPPPQEQRASITKAGTRGRAVALRTVKDVEIVDRAAVLAFFAGGAMMTEFLQTQAEKAVRAGVDVPGTTVKERKVAA